MNNSRAIGGSKNRIILELIRTGVGIFQIVRGHAESVFAPADEIDAEGAVGKDRVSVEVIADRGAVKNFNAGKDVERDQVSRARDGAADDVILCGVKQDKAGESVADAGRARGIEADEKLAARCTTLSEVPAPLRTMP